MKRETEQVLAAMDKETVRIMRDLGVNLRIVHKIRTWATCTPISSPWTFPRVRPSTGRSRADRIDRPRRGHAPTPAEMEQPHRAAGRNAARPDPFAEERRKPHMVKNVEKGTVLVGHELGIGLSAGDSIEIEGVPLKIARIMPEYGTLQDVQLVTHLEDAQKILNNRARSIRSWR
jgi:hypothetical protein